MAESLDITLVARIERCARDGVHQHGRGLVLALQPAGASAVSTNYVPLADIPGLFAVHWSADPVFVRWVNTYDLEDEYILMECVQVDEVNADAVPYLCRYRPLQQPPTA
jgi:hypothetical protein